MSALITEEEKNRNDVDRFFEHAPVPADFDQIKSSLQKFTQKQESNGVKIVCVTSGGTTVPFEKNTVRFLDNFSSGNRGASCTEHFLRQGYAVVFLSRIGSATPFARKFQKLLSPSYDLKFLQYLKVQDDGHLAIEFGTEKSKEQCMWNYISYVEYTHVY
mmetsp:Transcript_16456/g.19665  ORF Transcript_16456/g.19665 Transcript_16456/m.19665 type:complete len:160 (-) Transcript_16456:30-509(-)